VPVDPHAPARQVVGFRGVSRVARYGKAVAKQGKGGELAEVLLAAAAELESDPGCELYLINLGGKGCPPTS
jgi:hypothetical protein